MNVQSLNKIPKIPPNLRVKGHWEIEGGKKDLGEGEGCSQLVPYGHDGNIREPSTTVSMSTRLAQDSVLQHYPIKKGGKPRVTTPPSKTNKCSCYVRKKGSCSAQQNVYCISSSLQLPRYTIDSNPGGTYFSTCREGHDSGRESDVEERSF